jgi:threonyl-tRNA synthetase
LKNSPSLALLLGASVVKLYPGSKITLGPAIENGFYYDIDVNGKITDADLAKIEKTMREILKTWDVFEKKTLTKEEALKLFAGNPYKEEMIQEISQRGEEISIYQSGDFFLTFAEVAMLIVLKRLMRKHLN